jgi:type II secretory pathway component GspD/PulD (secretin)
MHSTLGVSKRHVHPSFSILAGVLVALAVFPPRTWPQSQSSEAKPADARAGEVNQTIFLHHATEANDLNDVETDLRNLFPRARMYAIAAQSAITIQGTPDEIAAAQRLVAELDRPRKVYRLTYTLTEMDGGRAAGTQHVAMTVAVGGKSTVKQGSRVPILTGSRGEGSAATSQQVQYVDLGLNIEASLEGSGESLRLHSQVEQSNLAEEKSGIGVQDPVIRQTKFEGVSTLAQGKGMVLGSLDISGSARQEQIEVVAELVR